MRQVQSQIKFILVVLRLHVGTQFIECLVVFFLLKVRQFVHHDHLQELDRNMFKEG